VGLSLASEQMGASLFGNNSRPSGILTTDANLQPEQITTMRANWEALHRGPSNQNKTAILDGGLSWQQTSISPDDAQFLETRKFQITEIARLFRIPPHMLADLERATFSNIEEQSLSFVMHTLRPWLVRWERELTRKLLTPTERNSFFVEFLVDGLLRGDLKSRNEALSLAVGGPRMTRNEARALDNLPPIDGGDALLTPLNMTTATMGGQPKQPKEVAA